MKKILKMKKILYILIAGMMTAGCNFLDVVPDNTTVLADAFKNETVAEKFLLGCYHYYASGSAGYGPFEPNAIQGGYEPNCSNECVGHPDTWTTTWFPYKSVQEGLETASSMKFDFWQRAYAGIRQCYIFLNNIDNVTPVTMQAAEFETYKQQWKGEARFLIAFYHYYLLIHYGPIVMIHGETVEQLPRLPYDQCVQEITAMFDEAIENLPSTVDARYYGRATKAIAKAVKAKMLTYAASPLYNGNIDYKNFIDKDGNQLINQTYDREKWKTAMDAVADAINEAVNVTRCSLYRYPETATDPFNPYNRTPVSGLSDFRKAFLNTRHVMVENWNSEIIWAYTLSQQNGGYGWQSTTTPKGIGTRSKSESTPVGGFGPTLTVTKLFYTANGLPPEYDPDYQAVYSNPYAQVAARPNTEDTLYYTFDAKVITGTTAAIHTGREPRFYANIGFDRGIYEYNTSNRYMLRLRSGEKNSNSNDHFYSGYAAKKPVNPRGTAEASGWSVSNASYAHPLIRLADLYLLYAEACAEYQGSLNTVAQGYMNDLSRRSGIPDFTERIADKLQYMGHKALGKGTLVGAIRRERMIEMVFEGQWHYDLRRWKKALEWYAPDYEGMPGLTTTESVVNNFYVEQRFPTMPYRFRQEHYLLPIQTDYVNKNERMVQNPGY
jgi:hypothetical protein